MQTRQQPQGIAVHIIHFFVYLMQVKSFVASTNTIVANPLKGENKHETY